MRVNPESNNSLQEKNVLSAVELETAETAVRSRANTMQTIESFAQSNDAKTTQLMTRFFKAAETMELKIDFYSENPTNLSAETDNFLEKYADVYVTVKKEIEQKYTKVNAQKYVDILDKAFMICAREKSEQLAQALIKIAKSLFGSDSKVDDQLKNSQRLTKPQQNVSPKAEQSAKSIYTAAHGNNIKNATATRDHQPQMNLFRSTTAENPNNSQPTWSSQLNGTQAQQAETAQEVLNNTVQLEQQNANTQESLATNQNAVANQQNPNEILARQNKNSQEKSGNDANQQSGNAQTQRNSQSQRQAETQAQSQGQLAAQAQPKGQGQLTAQPQGQGQAEVQAQPQGQGQAEVQAQPQGQGQTEVQTQPQGQGQAETQSQPQGQGQLVQQGQLQSSHQGLPQTNGQGLSQENMQPQSGQQEFIQQGTATNAQQQLETPTQISPPLPANVGQIPSAPTDARATEQQTNLGQFQPPTAEATESENQPNQAPSTAPRFQQNTGQYATNSVITGEIEETGQPQTVNSNNATPPTLKGDASDRDRLVQNHGNLNKPAPARDGDREMQGQVQPMLITPPQQPATAAQPTVNQTSIFDALNRFIRGEQKQTTAPAQFAEGTAQSQETQAPWQQSGLLPNAEQSRADETVGIRWGEIPQTHNAKFAARQNGAVHSHTLMQAVQEDMPEQVSATMKAIYTAPKQEVARQILEMAVRAKEFEKANSERTQSKFEGQQNRAREERNNFLNKTAGDIFNSYGTFKNTLKYINHLAELGFFLPMHNNAKNHHRQETGFVPIMIKYFFKITFVASCMILLLVYLYVLFNSRQ